jgi:sulfhydrogenase subunit beta (sulfur reductase)
MEIAGNADPGNIKRSSRVMTKWDMETLIGAFNKKYDVFGPVTKNGNTAFQKIFDFSEIDFDYESTILSPRKYLHKPFETLFSFSEDGKTVSASIPSQEERMQVLFGLHPCDVQAIRLLDKVFTGKYEDPYYIGYRKNTLIVALSCNTSRDTCFCTSFDSGPNLEHGADLIVTQLGDRFLVEPGSPDGEDLLKHLRIGRTMNDSTLAELGRLKAAKLETVANSIRERIDTDNLHKLLELNTNHPVWEELKQECLACGACTISCPTCFCFNITDFLDLSLQSGERRRVWDSCMLLEFAEVALGANFRNDLAARIKQRIYHKLYSFHFQHDEWGCVGCGRCIKYCIKNIDPRKIIEELRGDPIDL